MARVYLELIKQGKRTIDEVPKRIRVEVQKLIDEEEAKTNA